MSENCNSTVDPTQEFCKQYQVKLSDIKEQHVKRVLNQISTNLLKLLSDNIVVTKFKLAKSETGMMLSFVEIYPNPDFKGDIKAILKQKISINCPYDLDIICEFKDRFPLIDDIFDETADEISFSLIVDLDEM